MKYTTIPYSYDWDEIIKEMTELEDEYDTLDIESAMVNIMGDPSTQWEDMPDDSPVYKDGLYVTDFEKLLYTILYNGIPVLSFSDTKDFMLRIETQHK